MPLLSIQNLSLGYGGQAIVENLTFDVNAGDYLCIVGENGSGKTTLMKTLLGLQQPIQGEIVFDAALQRNEIGYLPQQTDLQRDFPASVREIVRSGCQGRMGLRPFYRSEEKIRAKELMERFGIISLENRGFSTLSGGQRQRVLLARALCATEKLLLLDEPVSGLDPAVTEDLYTLIAEYNRSGITVIQITHDILTAIQFASHILHIGPKIFYGTRDAYPESEIGNLFMKSKKGGDAA